MNKLFSIFLIILFFSCSKKRESNLPRIIVPEHKNVIEVNSKEMNCIWYYNFLVLNLKKDTTLSKAECIWDYNDKRFFKRFQLDTIFPKHNIKIIVDTSYTISVKGYSFSYFQYSSKEKNKVFQGNNYLKSYPLLILNNSKDTIYTRYKFIQEAKDRQGNWKPIEAYYNFGGCGNPESYYYKVMPNYYSVYPIIKYSGNFKTKLRIKLFNKGNIYYSNEFKGFINESQFDKTNFRKEFESRHPDYSFDESSKFFFLKF